MLVVMLSKTVILILILMSILFILEVSNIIYYNRELIKHKTKKALNKFKKSKNKVTQFD